MARSKNAHILIALAMGGVLLCAALCLAGYARMAGWPARAVTNPPEDLCGMQHEQIQSALVYELPTLIDRHTLCRLTPAAGFAWPAKGNLEPGNVPQQFWSQPPYWWQPRPSPQARFFMTPGFMADTRGPDGRYVLAMYDQARNEIYIWYKDNF